MRLHSFLAKRWTQYIFWPSGQISHNWPGGFKPLHDDFFMLFLAITQCIWWLFYWLNKIWVFFVKTSSRVGHPAPLSHCQVGHVTFIRHTGWTYIRIRMEAPYLHGRTSSSTYFMYFATLDTKLIAQDKLRNTQRI